MTGNEQVNSKKTKSYMLVIVLVVSMVVIVIAAGSYVYRDKQAKDQNSKNQATIANLQSEITDLKKQLNSQASSTSSTSSSNTATAVPSATTIVNITDAIKSGNTAALQGYMAPSVLVILAASEGIGSQTPAQAVADLKYLDNATDPWNFNLDATTLTKYANGDYKTYFKTNTLVGKSANNYVVAFNFNDAGKINGIFMAVSADLL